MLVGWLVSERGREYFGFVFFGFVVDVGRQPYVLRFAFCFARGCRCRLRWFFWERGDPGNGNDGGFFPLLDCRVTL